MKVVLINSYSDFNKGDLGIIEGTIESLKLTKRDIEINAVSSFNFNDPFFSTHHNELKKNVTKVYPAIIGRLFHKNNSKLALILKMLSDLIKIVLIYFGPFYLLRKIIFNAHELKTLKLIKESDLVISKGGSFICNEKGIIGFLRFVREMSVLLITIRLDRKLIIWGQSIGPIYGYFSLKLVNYILRRANKVILREENCITNYPQIRFPVDLIQGYDLAFSLPTYGLSSSRRISEGVVGITVKRFNSKRIDLQYTKIMSQAIKYIISDLNKKVALIPHVTIDDDISKAFEIYSMIPDHLKEDVSVFTDDYTTSQLLEIYRDIDFLIGTRLHSTIFSMVVNTKVINISYHGTKASGVFKKFNVDQFVIEGSALTFETLKNKIIQINKISCRELNYIENVRRAKQLNVEIAKEILS